MGSTIVRRSGQCKNYFIRLYLLDISVAADDTCINTQGEYMKEPKDLIEEIIQAGKRQIDIVTETGISRSSVSDIRKGICKIPSYLTMGRLLDYHKKVMQQKRRQDKKKELTEA